MVIESGFRPAQLYPPEFDVIQSFNTHSTIPSTIATNTIVVVNKQFQIHKVFSSYGVD